jgi:hypothetical protein
MKNPRGLLRSKNVDMDTNGQIINYLKDPNLTTIRHEHKWTPQHPDLDLTCTLTVPDLDQTPDWTRATKLLFWLTNRPLYVG